MKQLLSRAELHCTSEMLTAGLFLGGVKDEAAAEEEEEKEVEHRMRGRQVGLVEEVLGVRYAPKLNHRPINS